MDTRGASSMSVKYDVVHGENYEKNGEEKTRWTKCGVVLETRSGRLALKLEMIPVGFSGWFQLFDPNQDKDKKQSEQQGGQRQQGAPPVDFDADVPF